jgi:rhamnogalacturonyl hydrolase YesR
MLFRIKGKMLEYLLITGIFGFSLVFSQESFEDDEVYKTALEKGKLVAEYWTKRSGKNPSTTDYYVDICSYYGACMFGDATGDSSIYEYINSQYNRTTPITTTHIDNNSCGILPLHLYLHNGKEQLLKLGTGAADANIRADGHFRGASDDTYMTGSLHVQAYRATEDGKYLDFCAEYMVRYIESLQQDNGLYRHGANGSQQFWERGNGWASAGNAELLQVIPEDHELYDEVVAGFKNHMKGLIDVQLASGMWPQLLGSDDSRNWEETSEPPCFFTDSGPAWNSAFLTRKPISNPPGKPGWH